MVDARQNSLQDKIKRDCFHVRKNFRNEDNISVTLEWSCKEVYFQHQLTCPSHKTCEWQDLWTYFSTFQEWLPFALLGGGCIFEESKRPKMEESNFQIQRDFHHLLSKLSWDWWTIISFKVLVKFIFNFILALSFPALPLSLHVTSSESFSVTGCSLSIVLLKSQIFASHKGLRAVLSVPVTF